MQVKHVDVTVNLPNDEEDTFIMHDCTLDYAAKIATEAHPNWTSMVLVAVREVSNA